MLHVLYGVFKSLNQTWVVCLIEKRFQNKKKTWVVLYFTGQGRVHNTPLLPLMDPSAFSWGKLKPTEHFRIRKNTAKVMLDYI